MANERRKVTETDQRIPELLEFDSDADLNRLQSLCPCFGTLDGYDPHDRDCQQCFALYSLCLGVMGIIQTPKFEGSLRVDKFGGRPYLSENRIKELGENVILDLREKLHSGELSEEDLQVAVEEACDTQLYSRVPRVVSLIKEEVLLCESE